jgi:urease accessory protein
MSKSSRSLCALFFGLGAVLAPPPAWAHTALRSMGSFWSGVAHVLTSLDQIALLLGLAIWVSFQERQLDAPVIGAAFLACLAGMVVAAAVGSQFDFSPLVAALMVLVGLAAAARLQMGTGPVVALASAGGLLTGAASTAGAANISLGLYSLGGSIGAAAVISWGLIATRRVNFDWGRIALRAGASWIAAIGLMIVAVACSRYFGHR